MGLKGRWGRSSGATVDEDASARARGADAFGPDWRPPGEAPAAPPRNQLAEEVSAPADDDEAEPEFDAEPEAGVDGDVVDHDEGADDEVAVDHDAVDEDAEDLDGDVGQDADADEEFEATTDLLGPRWGTRTGQPASGPGHQATGSGYQPSGYQAPGSGYQPSGYQAPGSGYQPSGHQAPGSGYQPSGYQAPGSGYEPSGHQAPGSGHQPAGAAGEEPSRARRFLRRRSTVARRDVGDAGRSTAPGGWRRIVGWLVAPFRLVASWLWRGVAAVGRGVRSVLRILLLPLAPLGRWLGRALDGDRPPPRPLTLGAGIGLGIVAVGLAAVSVLTATATSAPTPPYLPVGPVRVIEGGVFDHDRGLLFVSDRHGPRAYEAPEGVELTWCEASGNVEGEDGTVWDREGRPYGAAGPLVQHAVTVYEGRVYLDRTVRDVPSGSAGGAAPPTRCVE